MPGAMITLATLLTALSTLSTASPTPLVSSTRLAPRKHFECVTGYIDWFDKPACPDEGDDGPFNQMAPSVVMNNTDCHALTPGSAFLTIGWCHLFTELTLYSDDACKDNVTTIHQRTEPKVLVEDCADLSKLTVASLRDTSLDSK